MSAISLEDRILIRKLAQAGWNDRQIAEQHQLNLHTVRKWRRRLLGPEAEAAVKPRGRPKRGALSTFPEPLMKQLQTWRSDHPGWGPKTLRTELSLSPAFHNQRLPHYATIARWLNEAGQAKRYQKRTELPSRVLSPTSSCHEEWELDARGEERIPELGLISLVQLNDVYSRTKLLSFPFRLGAQRLQHQLKTEDYQLCLRLAFLNWGLPDRLAVDRAHVFYDAQGKSPFPTRLHLWLVALGVELTFGRAGQPRDQAVTERSHQTWWQQVVVGQSFIQLVQLRRALDQRRTFLNEDLPCASLGERPPLVAHPQARQPKRPYRLEWEAQMLDLQAVYRYLGTCQWFRRVSAVGTISLGGHNYTLGKAWYNCQVCVKFDPATAEFIFEAPPREQKRLPNRWITNELLMGDLAQVLQVGHYQFALPFTWQEARQTYLLNP